MGCDMVVALNEATVQGHTLVGINHHDFRPQVQCLRRIAGAVHAPDEMLRLGPILLPQMRRTFTVLGNQPPETWGLTHGLNDSGVVAGFCRWQSRMPARETGLLGTDLIRLALERSQSADQAMHTLTDLISRHGLRSDGRPAPDNIFLLADAKEAFVVEAAGTFWALLECQHVRAVSDACLIRQDWWRLAPGLADHAVEHGWWTDDGSKLDVGNSMTMPAMRDAWAHKRWGKAMVMLEQQDGQIDSFFVRRLLCDHFEASAVGAPPDNTGTKRRVHLLGSFVAVLSKEAHVPPLAWCAFGPTGCPLFFPLLLAGDLPAGFDTTSRKPAGAISFVGGLSRFEELLASAKHAGAVTDALAELQARFDQEAEDFLKEAQTFSAQGNTSQVGRLSTMLMQNHWELFEKECRRLPALRQKSAEAGDRL